ncbi:GTP 3',8-cyclase MoaA [Flavobacterium filum]|uniref:GTP 3',8-cyclase MoaA n=1 Tax=Flavobacterium filum TaxID=370974 RepID=UPI00047E180F|nr:GTP 3',8-cyclase MoaA [Flavobacterium filum]
MLYDKFQRKHDYLRVSLTDSCNFRCLYCMPNEDITFMPQRHLMQREEIFEIAKTFSSLGVTKIRLTGGEPLVRKDAQNIIKDLSGLPVELTLTTNGFLVHQFIQTFKDSGIKSLNVSLDTMCPKKFHELTKRNSFNQVWENILLLIKHKFSVKLNVVVMKGVNQDEVVNFVQLTQKLPLHVRFIEFMPFDKNQWNSLKVVPFDVMLQQISSQFDVVKLKDKKHDTAKKFKVIGFEGTFAFITTMSQPFCSDCNRMRLTADGKMKNCLFGKDELDLLTTLRSSAPIEPIIRKALFLKHQALGGQMQGDFTKLNPELIDNRSMIKIGG